MLLRGSGEHSGETYGLEGLIGAAPAGIPHEAELRTFAESFHANDAAALDAARRTLCAALGDAALVDAAGVAGIFDAVVRIADATGTPLEDYKAKISEDFRDELGINDFPSARPD